MTATSAAILYLLTRLDRGIRDRKPRPGPLLIDNFDWIAVGYPARLRGAVRRIKQEWTDGRPRTSRQAAAFLGCTLADIDVLTEAGLLKRVAR